MRPVSLIALLLGLALVLLLARTMLQGTGNSAVPANGKEGLNQAEAVRQELESSLDAATDRLNRGLEQSGAD